MLLLTLTTMMDTPMTSMYITHYESIATDVDAAMGAAIESVWRTNVGFVRSPELTEGASLVQYLAKFEIIPTS